MNNFGSSFGSEKAEHWIIFLLNDFGELWNTRTYI